MQYGALPLDIFEKNTGKTGFFYVSQNIIMRAFSALTQI
jgi:hypothetical protein